MKVTIQKSIGLLLFAAFAVPFLLSRSASFFNGAWGINLPFFVWVFAYLFWLALTWIFKKHILEFDIFDGFAYCADYNGKEYYMLFPKKEFINLSKEMQKTAREFLNLDEHAPLQEEHLLASYNTLYVND